MKKLSIIIAAYNVENYIEQCIKSVIGQKYVNDIEVIIVNDGSEDSTESIVKKMIDDHTHLDIKVINKKNGGLSDARNKGLSIATGEYITFLDGDDVLLDNYSCLVLDIICDNDLVSINARRFIKKIGDVENDVVDITQSKYEDLRLKIFDCNQWFSWARICKRSLFKDVKFPVGRRFEDIATTPKLYFKAEKIHHISEPLIGYRINPSSITRNPIPNDTKDILYAVDSISGMELNNSDLNAWMYSVRNLGGISRFLHENCVHGKENKEETLQLYARIWKATLSIGIKEIKLKYIYNTIVYPLLLLLRIK